MKTFKLLNTTVLILFISACTSIPLKTMYHLAKTDLMTVDPEHYSAALRVPNTLREGEEGVRMILASWLVKKKESAQVLEVRLVQVVDSEALLAIKPLTKPNYTTFYYKISDKDIGRINTFRKKLKIRKQIYGDALKGSFSIGVSYCRKNKLDDKPILVSTWMTVSKESGLLPLLIDHDFQEDLQKLKEENKSIDEVLPLCIKN